MTMRAAALLLRLPLAVLAMALWAAPPATAQKSAPSEDPDRTLRIPGFPPIPLPPGAKSFGGGADVCAAAGGAGKSVNVNSAMAKTAKGERSDRAGARLVMPQR